MNSSVERLAIKGAYHEKKMEKMRLATKADGLIRSIKQSIQGAAIIPLRELKTDEALEMMKELHAIRKSYLKICDEITEIERELG